MPLAAQAQGGSYGAPAYTGGQLILQSGGGSPNTINYTTNNGKYGYDYYASAGPGQTASANASGTISYTSTWNGGSNNLPVPSAVLKTETCTVEYTGVSFSTGSDVNPLAAPGALAPSPLGTAWTCTRYSILHSPSATISGSLAGAMAKSSATVPTGSYATVSAGVFDAVSFTPVTPTTITITGTTPAGGSQVMTGQQLTATLNVPSGFTVYHAAGQTGYQWAVSSSTAFETYDTSAPTATHPTQLVPLSAADLSATSLKFYDRAAGTLQVTCTVTLLEPDGVTQVSDTVTSQTITVMKPTVTSWMINTGPAQTLMDPIGVHISPGNIMFANEFWGPITITVPPLGTTNIGGLGCIAQVITNQGDVVNGAPNMLVDVVKNASGKNVAVLTPALDTGFPYQVGYQTNAQGQMNPNAPTTSSQWTIPQSGANQSGYSGDQPFMPIFPTADTSWTKSLFSRSFQTYVMYLPPGGVWVPLKMITWNCSSTAGPSAGGDITDPSDGSLWASSNSQFFGGTVADVIDPPSWVYTVAKGTLLIGPISK